jgi:hypothetical protein
MIQPNQQENLGLPGQKVSWSRAATMMMTDRRNFWLLRYAPAEVVAYLPINVMDEPIPLLGQLDDLPWLAAAAFVVYKLAKYRRGGR